MGTLVASFAGDGIARNLRKAIPHCKIARGSAGSC